MTEDIGTPRTVKSAKRRFVRLALALAVLATPVLIFFAASTLTNRIRIPAELAKMPPALAAQLAPAATAVQPGDAPDEFAFPVADWTHAYDFAADFDMATTSDSNAQFCAFLEAELRGRPELEGARIYLDLHRRFQVPEQMEDLCNFCFSSGAADWRPGHPLPSVRAQQLVRYADVVEQFLRLAESTGLPLRSREEIARDPDTYRMPVPDIMMLDTGMKMLGAEGQRRLETGDPAGAEHYWRATIRLAANVSGEPCGPFGWLGSRDLDFAVRPLASWVGANDIPRDTLTGLRILLTQAHRSMFPSNRAADTMLVGYAADRVLLVAKLDSAPWRDRVFGWDAGEYPWAENADFSFRTLGLDLPRLDRLATNALQAMRFKNVAPHVLTELDRMAGEAIRRERMTWPELAAAEPCHVPEGEPFTRALQFINCPAPYWNEHSMKLLFLRSETWLSLLRAAIEWRLAPADAKPDPAAMKIEDRESPWRDPFAEAPFHASMLSDGGVLLYSLGPDLEDQLGQIEYDPTNGTMSPGDLTLEVKR